MTTTNKVINDYLKGARIAKDYHDDFKIVVNEVGYDKQILEWFSYLHSIEIVGWRTKTITKKIATILKSNNKKNKLLVYALFCPSYNKGKGAIGFRIDDVGSTTKWGINTLLSIYKNTIKLGFRCNKPIAIFFDLAVEQADKVISSGLINDLETNINNFKHYLPSCMKFFKLSELDSKLFRTIGYKGVVLDPLPVPTKTFHRIVKRGEKFYKLFGWSDTQITKRSRIIASSEAIVGSFLKKRYPYGIMVYTPTMLERAAVYSGMKCKTDPLPIIFPRNKYKGS